MNTPAKRLKSITLSKKCDPSRGSTKHRKRHFPSKRTGKGLLDTKKEFYFSVNFNYF